MNQFTDCLEWPAKAEPFSPFAVDDNGWILTDDLVSNDGIFVPLSLIQKEFASDNNEIDIEELSTTFISSNTSYSTSDTPYDVPDSPNDDFSEQHLPFIKYEEYESPPFSPIQTSDIAPIDKISRAQLASKLLNDLDTLKEEPIPEWFEEKNDLPIFEDIPAAREPVRDTQYLLQEFESVCGAIGLNSVPQFDHLTPPQSPPGVQYRLPVARHAEDQSSWSYTQLEPVTSSDIAKELAVVDDIVYNTARNIDWQDGNAQEAADDAFTIPLEYTEIEPAENDLSSEANYASGAALGEASAPSPSSPGSSSSSSYGGTSENDDEWLLSPSDGRTKSKVSNRSKPYSRNPEDKRSRKKEQNKNAATRYRQKKKAEIEILMDEEKKLISQRDDMLVRYADVRREVSYLKSLMRDLFKAKGLIK